MHPALNVVNGDTTEGTEPTQVLPALLMPTFQGGNGFHQVITLLGDG